MNTLVNITIAKLLKEKGFNEKTNSAYVDTTPFSEIKDDLVNYVFLQNHNGKEHRISAPIIAEVIMWLYKKHSIWISVEPFIKNDNTIVNIYKIFKNGHIDTISRGSMGFGNPTEAYEAAIKYTLNNLI